MYTYKCKLDRVVDGDTVDVDIDLGFGVWLHSQRIRLEGIDAPETRTLDDVEKVFGFAAKQRVEDLIASSEEVILHSKNFEGKFGRIIGDFELTGHEKHMTEILLEEGHAVDYYLEDHVKEKTFKENQQKLIESGAVDLSKDS